MTTYTNVPIAAAGDWIDDAYINTYLGDNLRALWGAFTGAGQLLASTGVNSLNKVAVTGNNGYLLTEDTSLPEKMKFAAPPISLPAGGSDGQVLSKVAGVAAWATFAQYISSLQRQGGSASVWDTQGVSNYTPANMLVQMGVINITISSAAYGSLTVTFPTAFSNYPLVFTTIDGGSSDYYNGVNARAAVLSNSTVKLSLHSNVGGVTVTLPVHWLAIGPG